MFFKLKKIILVQFCFFFFFFTFSVFAAHDTLIAPTSSFAASSAAGASAPGNESMSDANPAILPALKRQYSVFGGASWQSSLDLVEVGVFDSITTPVAMVIRGRETIPYDIPRDRSFKAAIGYQIPMIPNLSLGIAGEYQQFNLTEVWSWQDTNYRFDTGAFYQINSLSSGPIFLGLSAKGLFDKYNPSIVDIGISKVTLNGFYTFNIDTLLNSKSGFQSVVGGVNILIQTYFDIKGSIGYNPKEDRFFWGAGIFFKSPVFHLYYTLVRTDSNDTTIRQTAGVELVFSL